MNKADCIQRLLTYVLSVIAEASTGVEIEETERGCVYTPRLRYLPIFDFDEEDIQLIHSLEQESMQDWSTLLEN